MLLLLGLLYAVVVGPCLAWIVRTIRADHPPAAVIGAVLLLLVLVFAVRTPVTLGRHVGVEGDLSLRASASAVGLVGAAVSYLVARRLLGPPRDPTR